LRLDQQVYAQTDLVCSVTIRTRRQPPVFACDRIASAAVEVLISLADRTGVYVHGYCVMPDHVHIVLSASPTWDIIAFVGRFKNLVQRAFWELGGHGTMWQRRFWDHFPRREEDVRSAVTYGLANPVRAGLVKEWQSYRFSGSLVWRVR
jgi:putative transposase